MNERIEELAEQCRTITDYGMGKYENFDAKRFAELIVNECIAAAMVQPDSKWVSAEVLIKRHFGVEK